MLTGKNGLIANNCFFDEDMCVPRNYIDFTMQKEQLHGFPTSSQEARCADSETSKYEEFWRNLVERGNGAERPLHGGLHLIDLFAIAIRF